MTASAEAPRRARVLAVVTLLRRLKAEGDRLATVVAAHQRVNHTDLAALMHIMEADNAGRAMTPGALQRVLGLSSGATTAVIDRLEGLDHARRDRDTVDRRRVHLRYGAGARALGERYFGPLGAGVSAVLGGFTDAELAVVERFLSEVVGVYDSHSTRIDAMPRDAGTSGEQVS